MLSITATTGAPGGWKSALVDALIVAAYTAIGVLAGMGLDVIRTDPIAALYASVIAFSLAFLSSMAAYRNLVLPLTRSPP